MIYPPNKIDQEGSAIQIGLFLAELSESVASASLQIYQQSEQFLLLKHPSLFNRLILMRLNATKQASRSALDQYDNLGAWDEQDFDEGENIFKLLKTNLHNYEKTYNHLHPKSPEPKLKIDRILSSSKAHRENKQNLIKLPTLQTTPLKKKASLKAYSHEKTILAIKEVQSQEIAKKPPVFLFDLNKNSSNKQFCEINNNFIKRRDIFKHENSVIRRNRLFNVSRTGKYSKMRLKAENRLAEYEFGDQKMIYRRSSNTKERSPFGNIENE